MAKLGTKTAGAIAATALADLTFGTGYNCISAAVNRAIADRAKQRSNANTSHHDRISTKGIPIGNRIVAWI